MFKKIILSAMFFCGTFLNSSAILQDDKILNEKVRIEMDKISKELLEKSGIFIGVAAINSLQGKSLKQKAQELIEKIPQKSYAFILLSKKEHKVEIYESEDVKKYFDKEEVLSPFPNKGSILPILTLKKGEDLFSAALLNGFADIAERIANSKNIKLDSAIGNSNKNIINFIRFLVYGSILLVIFVGIYYKFLGKKDAK